MQKIIFVLLLSCSFSIFAQQKNNFMDKVRFGGSFSLGFGNQTTIGISPSAIYDFEKGFSLGLGLTYIYSEINDFTTNVYGGSIISLYQIPTIGIQLSGEYEYSYATQKDNFNSIRTTFPALYIGAAYTSGRFAFGMRYDVLYDENKSIYASPFSPIIRFYF